MNPPLLSCPTPPEAASGHAFRSSIFKCPSD
jgi:hypothetical protein